MGRHSLLAANLVLALALAALTAAPTGANSRAKNVVAFKATLTGAAEPGGGDPDGAGKGTFVFHEKTRKLCWTLTFSHIGTPTASHIHKGAAGVSGPVVVPLGGTFKRTGCTTVDSATASAFHIHVNPFQFYVNIHTAKYPNGAIRGPLTYCPQYGMNN